MTDFKTDKDFFGALAIIKGELKERLLNLPENIKSATCEIRLRTGKPVIISGLYGNRILYRDSENTPFICYSEDVANIFSRICSYSVHSHIHSIVNGFVTVQGGHRVGICGTAVFDSNNNIISVRDISSLNIRISREKKGCADELYRKVFSNGVSSVIIAGSPMSGKTTVLRDLVRQLSEGNNMYKVCVIDERQEIAAMNAGFCQRDIGINTDVFDLYPKERGIECAVRTMAPDIIAMDELCNDKEIEAINLAVNSGVKFIVTVHASDYSELLTRPQIKSLLRAYSFEKLVLLKNHNPGKIEGIYDTKELLDEIIGRNIGLGEYNSSGREFILTA